MGIFGSSLHQSPSWPCASDLCTATGIIRYSGRGLQKNRKCFSKSLDQAQTFLLILLVAIFVFKFVRENAKCSRTPILILRSLLLNQTMGHTDTCKLPYLKTNRKALLHSLTLASQSKKCAATTLVLLTDRERSDIELSDAAQNDSGAAALRWKMIRACMKPALHKRSGKCSQTRTLTWLDRYISQRRIGRLVTKPRALSPYIQVLRLVEANPLQRYLIR